MASAQAPTFDTPQKAVASLRAALESEHNTELLNLFGDETRSLLDNADEAEMAESRRLLNLLFEERWALSETENGNRLLRLGLEGWPFPVPLVADNSTWRFDTKAGLEEISNRRIGRNELVAIETCLRILDAQESFRLSDPNNDGVREYSNQFRSSPDKRDGLYWEAEEDEPISPLQEALTDSWKYAEARTEGSPWFGYRFRFLEGQGADAPGGPFSYTINGHQLAGFGVIAYPATYGESGVMTFLISQNGTVFEKDLGADTKAVAESMKLFNPDATWEEVAEDVD